MTRWSNAIAMPLRLNRIGCADCKVDKLRASFYSDHRGRLMGRRITLELPDHLVDRIDELKKEWCIRARGDCLTRLLEEIWTDETDFETDFESGVGDLLNTRSQRGSNGLISRDLA